MSTSKKPAVIIPNLNGVEFLQESLDSLDGQGVLIDTIVVDNGSTDGSTGLVKKLFPRVHLIELKNNQGFAGGG